MKKLLLLATLLSASAFAQPPMVGQYLLRVEPVRAGFTFQNMTDDERRLLTEHAAYLKGLLDQGKLTLAGQAFDPKGLFGIIVVNASNPQEAAALLNGDPGVKGKVFRGEAVPFRTVFFSAAAPAAK